MAAQFILLLLFFGWFSERRSSDGCLSCHEDASRMEELGYPQFTVTAAEAQEQSRMPRTTCIDCHLGEGGTRDAYALLGTFGDLPENNLHLAWIQLDQASHPLGPSRDCDSCHGREDQVSRSSWKYVDGQGARPFSGSHVVTADREGLRIGEFEIDGEIELREGARLSDFAA